MTLLGALRAFRTATLSASRLFSEPSETRACGPRYFLKEKYPGRLSLVTEDTVKSGGVHHYQARYVEGDVRDLSATRPPSEPAGRGTS